MKMIPLKEKIPAITGWQTKASDDCEQQKRWIDEYGSIGLLTGSVNNIVVLDFDDKEKARDFYKKYRTILKTIVETKRGVHFYFQHPKHTVRNAVKVNGLYDIRGDGGYVVYPPSHVNGWEYRFVQGFGRVASNELSDIPGELLPIEREKVKRVIEHDPIAHVIRARAYISKIDGAISGNGGHRTTFRVACKLIQEFGLTRSEALALFLEWNEKCQPKWSILELQHKLDDAERSNDG